MVFSYISLFSFSCCILLLTTVWGVWRYFNVDDHWRCVGLMVYNVDSGTVSVFMLTHYCFEVIA